MLLHTMDELISGTLQLLKGQITHELSLYLGKFEIADVPENPSNHPNSFGQTTPPVNIKHPFSHFMRRYKSTTSWFRCQNRVKVTKLITDLRNIWVLQQKLRTLQPEFWIDKLLSTNTSCQQVCRILWTWAMRPPVHRDQSLNFTHPVGHKSFPPNRITADPR